MPQTSSLGEFQPIVARGPRVEMNHAALIGALGAPSTIAPSATWTSPLISADGFYEFVLGVTLSNAGTLELLRFIDDAGEVAVDSGQSQTLTAATAGVLVVSDGKPCASFQVKIVNGAATTANVANLAALCSAF